MGAAVSPVAPTCVCVGFADEQHGGVGALTPSRRLFETRDGGTTWLYLEHGFARVNARAAVELAQAS